MRLNLRELDELVAEYSGDPRIAELARVYRGYRNHRLFEEPEVPMVEVEIVPGRVVVKNKGGRPSQVSPALRNSIRTMRTQGNSLARIAEHLTRTGYPTPTGKAKWSVSSVAWILTEKRTR